MSSSETIPDSPHPGQYAAYRWLEQRRDGLRWQIRSDVVPLFEQGDEPDWRHLSADPRGETIKHNAHRRIVRLGRGGHDLMVKVSIPQRGGAPWRRLLLGSDAEGERRVADYAARHGVATVEPLAAADSSLTRRPMSSILITRTIPGAVQLDHLWAKLDNEAASTRSMKNRLINETARLIASGHQNGFRHLDLHPGNILMQTTADDCRAFFVDLHNVRIGRRVGDRDVIYDLAQLNQWFMMHGLLTDRVRFVQRYLEWYGRLATTGRYGRRLDCDKRDLFNRLEVAIERHADRLYRKHDRRCMRNGRYFARLRLPDGCRALVYRRRKDPLPGSPASAMLVEPDDWRDTLSSMMTSPVANGTQTISISGRDVRVHILRQSPTSLWQRLRYWLGPSRLLREWKNLHRLLHRQVPVALPLAVVYRRGAGRAFEGLLIQEAPENDMSLSRFIEQVAGQPGADRLYRWKVGLTDATVDLFVRMMRGHCIVPTCTADQLRAQYEDGWRRPRVKLMRADGLYLRFRARPERWLPALITLNRSLLNHPALNRADRLRFLYRLCHRWRWREVRLRGLARQIEKASRVGDAAQL